MISVVQVLSLQADSVVAAKIDEKSKPLKCCFRGFTSFKSVFSHVNIHPVTNNNFYY